MRHCAKLLLLCSSAILLGGEAQSREPADGTQESGGDIVVFGRVTRDTALTIPQSVDVLDGVLIESSGSDTVGDALRFVPGASRDGSVLDAFGDSYLIRGFPANQTVNGINPNALRQARDSIAIERIEVLKGPASVLYGQLQPGAVVNIVTKQPERLGRRGEPELWPLPRLARDDRSYRPARCGRSCPLPPDRRL